MLITSKGSYFIADTQVRPNPSAEELAEVASLAAIHVQRFNMKPPVAFVQEDQGGTTTRQTLLARADEIIEVGR